MRWKWLAVGAVAFGLLAGCGDPDPFSASVKAERKEATAAVEAYAPDGAEPIATAQKDVCQAGQRNWKVKEPKFQCTVGHAWVVPMARGRGEVGPALASWQELAESRGCTPRPRSDLTMAQRYWREGTTTDPAKLPAGRFECGAVTLSLTPTGPSDPYIAPISLVGPLTGEDLATPVFVEYPKDIEQQITSSGQIALMVVLAEATYGGDE